ncbi:MAG: HDOD domain-containing protein [Rhodocyclaceae bacterium]|nr:HDOD domain-containing protein [Rhodocyclaceae bacterium]MCO5097446.1 HDOD domain-containing protein [Rhodocyclaceae bacterium]
MHPHDGLNAWLERIRDQELPIFGRTAEQIRALTDSDKAAVSQLADAILCDPGMTAKLLRIGNSVIFNTSGAQITTVSRAVLMIGFNQVRQVALSVAFVDALLRGPVRERVLRELARACHAAVQARWLAVRRHDAQPEEVFIAALLYRFGDMAFWCLAGETGDELEEALRLNPQTPGDVEQSLLGFRLPQLTVALTRDWRVSPLLQSVLKGGYPKRSREYGVALAFRLAEGSEAGWGSKTARARLKEAADFVQLPVEDITEAIRKNAAEAAIIADCYGATAAARFIPQ